MQQKTTPWLALALGLLGLVAGYGAVVLGTDTVVAKGRSCPSRQGTCAHGECDKQKCNGECGGAHCPGCQKNV